MTTFEYGGKTYELDTVGTPYIIFPDYRIFGVSWIETHPPIVSELLEAQGLDWQTLAAVFGDGILAREIVQDKIIFEFKDELYQVTPPKHPEEVYHYVLSDGRIVEVHWKIHRPGAPPAASRVAALTPEKIASLLHCSFANKLLKK